MNAVRGIKGNPPNENQFYPVSVSDVITVSEEEVTEDNDPSFGPFIQLTFHPTFLHLLQEFYGIVNFIDDSFTAGGLANKPDEFASDYEAQQKISSVLGLLPEHANDTGLSFVLARYWKIARNHTAVFGVKDDYVDAFKQINREQPNNIINLFTEYGTHYISDISEGDFIYQVYVYERHVFEEIDQEYPDDPNHRFGLLTSVFRGYTKPRVLLPDGQYTGYTKHVGTILAASQDLEFQDIEPLLYDDIYEIQSILIFVIKGSVARQTDKMTSLIEYIILNSIGTNVYSTEEMELQNAWEEVLKGAVFQIFDKGSSPGFRTIENDPLASNYEHFNPELVTKTATSYTSIVEATFDLADLDILNKDFVQDLLIVADTIELPAAASIHLPGSASIYLICRHFLSYSSGNAVPQIIVGSSASEPSVTIVASNFSGVMKLVSQHSGNHMTYIEGSVFITEKQDEEHFVVSDSSKELTHPWPSVTPEFYANVTSDYQSKWFVSAFLSGMDLLMMTVESVYTLQISSSTTIAQKSLKWIINTLAMAKHQTKLSSGLEVVLNRALLLHKMNPIHKVFFCLFQN